MSFTSYYDSIYTVTNTLVVCVATGTAAAAMTAVAVAGATVTTAVAVADAAPKVYNAASEYFQPPQSPDYQKFNYTIDDKSDPDFDFIDFGKDDEPK